MNAVKFFVVRFPIKDFNLDIPIFICSFCKEIDADIFAKRLNKRFPQYSYRVLNLEQLNKLGILPF